MLRVNLTSARIPISLFFLLLWCSGCTTDYVTGKKTFSLVSESQELAIGREADPQIVAEYGLYNDEGLQTFVNNIGQKLAKTSQRADLVYTFRVVDSPIVNAFALPGGFVYVTRGILAHFNSEDELAGVLGHEIGHVVARHGAEQMSRQQLAGLGLGLGSIFSERFRQIADQAGVGVSLLFLKFGRGQESESDRLGVEYATKVGYDAHDMAGFFRTLKRLSEGNGQSLPSFLSTHPDPGQREQTVHRLADEWQKKVPYKPLDLARIDYLKRIDGIVFGEDPRQGYVENNVFYHPSLKFQFSVPDGWQTINSSASVQLVSPDQKAAIQMTLGKTASSGQEAQEFISKSGVTVVRQSTSTVNGFRAALVESSLKNQQGESLGILSYFIEKDQNVYVFHGFTSLAAYGRQSGTFSQTMSSFKEVRDQAVINKKPRRLQLKRAPRAGTVESNLSSLGADPKIISRLAIINGMSLDTQVPKGEWLKVVTK